MDSLLKFVNYMVPATGNTRGYIVSETLSATPKQVNFFNVELDGVPFRPSGAFIDNTQGTQPLVIRINELAYNIVVPAGGSMQTQFPAPMSMSVAITGAGQATIIFVDFPVIPFFPQENAGGGGGGGGAVTVANGADIAQGNTADVPQIDPLGTGSVIALLKGLMFTVQAQEGRDSDGNLLPQGFGQYAQTMTYDGGGNLETVTRTDGFDSWVQTLTYTGGNLTAVSAWVKQ